MLWFSPDKIRKGTVDTSVRVKHAVKLLSQQWPIGAQVLHVPSGRTGYVKLDNPANVPGTWPGADHEESGDWVGAATAWCLTSDGDAVSVSWLHDGVPRRVWLPTRELRLTGRSR